MFRLMFAIALVVQTSDAATVVKQLREIEQQLAAAWKKGDCDGWGSFIAPEWSVIHVDGNTLSRAQALEICRAKEPPIEELIFDDVAVHPYGDAAVVTGRTFGRVGGATPLAVRLRFTDFFV